MYQSLPLEFPDLCAEVHNFSDSTCQLYMCTTRLASHTSCDSTYPAGRSKPLQRIFSSVQQCEAVMAGSSSCTYMYIKYWKTRYGCASNAQVDDQRLDSNVIMSVGERRHFGFLQKALLCRSDPGCFKDLNFQSKTCNYSRSVGGESRA